MAKKNIEDLDEANASVLVEMLVDDATSEHQRLQIIQKLLEGKGETNFFLTMFEENLSLGQCPHCDHENHWAIPEDALSEFGWTSHKKDSRVPQHTNEKNCPEFQEACKKKKVVG